MPHRFQFRLQSLFLMTLLVGVVIATGQQFGSAPLPFLLAMLSGWAGTKYDISRGRATLARGAFTGTLAAALGFMVVAAIVRYYDPMSTGGKFNYLVNRNEAGEDAVSGAAIGILLTALATAKRNPQPENGTLFCDEDAERRKGRAHAERGHEGP